MVAEKESEITEDFWAVKVDPKKAKQNAKKTRLHQFKGRIQNDFPFD